eukprot:4054351-Pyramimonas_sp.AAC.1
MRTAAGGGAAAGVGGAEEGGGGARCRCDRGAAGGERPEGRCGGGEAPPAQAARQAGRQAGGCADNGD